MGGDISALVWNTILTVALFLMGLYSAAARAEAKEMKDGIKANADALAAHKLHAAEKFAPKADLERLSDKLDERFDKVDEALEKLTSRLPPKQH